MKALCGIVVAVVLAGCSQSLRTPDANSPVPGDAQQSTTSEPLLYVATARRKIQILSLPGYTAVAQIQNIGYIQGMCADPAGDVWVVNVRNGYSVIDEFAHGGTSVIARIRPEHGWYLTGCAVDPTSGNLAVVGSNIYGGARVLVWPGAHNGKPAQYPGLCCASLFAVYDNNGNLYVSGAQGGDDWFLVLGELAKGSSTFTTIKLDKRGFLPGEVQWDGTNLVVATGFYSAPAQLYRVEVHGNKGEVVQRVRYDGLVVGPFESVAFALYDNTAIGRASLKGKIFLGAWQYPAGGKIIQRIGDYDDPTDVVISP